ncbi:hypothetical protein FAZ95_36725 [Trinickia violacea]|uniref:Uncharacterized protein n=1 Tax=Trinickia violacea TaxID=2571746 RepID=A0A4P8J0Z9_9BURK|nr:hypothetical protein FAZ95_36725 [Trinickia violacea]
MLPWRYRLWQTGAHEPARGPRRPQPGATARTGRSVDDPDRRDGARAALSPSLSDFLCVRHKLTAKEPLYATQTKRRNDGGTGQGVEPGPGADQTTGARDTGPGDH